MNAKIDREGILWIERAGAMKKMSCAKRHDHYCRDVCPLFGEIDPGHDAAGYIDVKKASILICDNAIITGNIVDERGTPWAPEEKDE